MKKIFWVAGDISGDLHASEILKKLQDKNFYHYGIGGANMQKTGFKPIADFDKLSVMGFWDVLKKIGFFIKLKKQIENTIKKDNPDLVILVDYPGLNMKIAKFAKKLGIKVIFYIAPQFWAWKYKRIYELKKYTDLVSVIFKFEEDILKKEGITAKFVGHPITEEISFKISKQKFAEKYSLDTNKKWIAFFPGSRKSELKKMLPVFVQTIKRLKSENDFEFLISQAKNIPDNYFLASDYKLIKGDNYELMKYADALAITSGTATLEASYIGTPFVICYKTNKFNYLLGKHFIKTRWIGLPNIILNKSAFKELIQNDANPDKIASEILKMIKNPNRDLQDDFAKIKEILSDQSASENMAKIINKYVEK